MDCIVDKLGKAIQEEEVSCLPLQVLTIFDKMKNLDLPLCKNDTGSALRAYLVC